MKYVLGLDLGIASVGWALLVKDEEDNLCRIADLGSRVFKQLEDKDGKLENVDRRGKRSMRRQRRRKTRRLGDLRDLFIETFAIDFSKLKLSNYRSPYEIKIKGLKASLATTELVIALYHYMKYRGFKSSRKVEDTKNEGVLLAKIESIRSELSADKTITEVLIDRFNNQVEESKRIHNTTGEYYLTVSRDMYLDELEKLFDVQINSGGCTSNFKQEFLNIYTRQRDFSEGPGKGSKFGAKDGTTFIEKMLGKCYFDDNTRAPKDSYSAEGFVLLSFLNNIRYKVSSDEKRYSSLLPEEISIIFEMAKTKKEISYIDIFKTINRESLYRIKGLELTKKQYISQMNKFKDKNKINSNRLSIEQFEMFSKYSKEELLKIKLPVGMSSFFTMKKAFLNEIKENKLTKQEIEDFISNEKNFDDVAYILLTNKTDSKIKEKCAENGYANGVIKAILTLPEFKKTIDLSSSICEKIIPLLLLGKGYDKAMSELGYDHFKRKELEKQLFLPEIDVAMKDLGDRLTNPTVRHTLVYARQIINELIKKYGEISSYNIELARDLKRSFADRRKMQYDMLDNQDHNNSIKEQLLRKYPDKFKSVYHIKKDDLLKYKLFKEQGGRSAYTNDVIHESLLFDDNEYQIDHILPYSRSFDDSYNNKVLVETKQNQDKGNRIPKEAFGSDQMKKIMEFISNSQISNKKRDNILVLEIDDDFTNGNKNDSSYIAKLAKKLIETYLKPESCTCPSGGVTDKLKYMWGLKGYTHSYLNPKYRNNLTYILQTYSIGQNKITLNFMTLETKEEKTIDIVTISSGKKILSHAENELNEAIAFFATYPSLLEAELARYLQKSIHLFIEKLNNEAFNINKEIFNMHLLTIGMEMYSLISKDKQAKDRSNDLHHALDAVVIAATTHKMITRITNYYRNEEEHKVVDALTGEIKDDFEKFPLPYVGFREDAITRVYERNAQLLLEKLNDLSPYKDAPLERRDVHVLYPTRQPEKYHNGALTQETIFGLKNGVIRKRVHVSKLTEKNIDKIVDSLAGNKPVYEACKEWLAKPEKSRSKYPFHPTKGKPIKSVISKETDDINSRVHIKDNKFAINESCVRVDVYTKRNENNKLFFVPIFNYQLVTEASNKKGKKVKPVNYEIMWGRGGNSDYISAEKLSLEYTKVASLPRYSLIEIKLKSGAQGLCYSAGATSGIFYVYSIIGDGIDLIKDRLFGKILDRYSFTVSQIVSIKVRSISCLGHLN